MLVIKKIVFLLVWLFIIQQASGQQYTAKNLTGVWRVYLNSYPADLAFLNDSIAVYTLPDGLKIGYINYNTQSENGIIKFRYTNDLYSIKKRYRTEKITFLNDSTFYFIKGSNVPPIDDSKLRHNQRGLYKKVKLVNPIVLRLPVWQDLKGDWFQPDNLNHIIIKDDSNATFIKKGGKTDELKYVLNVDKYPMTILFTDKVTSKQELIILRFLDHENLMLTRGLKNKPLEREPGFAYVSRYNRMLE